MTEQDLEIQELRIELEKKSRENAKLSAQIEELTQLRYLLQGEIVKLRRMIGAYEGE